MSIRSTLALAVIGVLALGQPGLAITIFPGGDEGVGPGDLRPNSESAAAAFDAAASALGTVHVVDLENLSAGAFSSIQLAPGVTATLTNADSSVAGIINTGGSAADGFNTTAGGSAFLRVAPLQDSGITSVTLAFQFEQGIQAGGMYLTGLGMNGGTLTATFDDGTVQQQVEGLAIEGAEFFGFTLPGANIRTIQLTLTNLAGFASERDLFAFDDLRFVSTQPAVATPEPASAGLLLMAIALGAIRMLVKRYGVGLWRANCNPSAA